MSVAAPGSVTVVPSGVCPYAGIAGPVDLSKLIDGEPKEKLRYEKTALQRHVEFFADKSRVDLTEKSMKDGHYIQQITKGVYPKVWAISNILHGGPSTVGALCKVQNPAASGFWDKEGHFDEEAFAKLREKSIEDKGEEIITRAMVDQYLKERHGEQDLGTATYLARVIPVTWKAVTEGSFDELFKYYADYMYVNKKGKAEQALTVKRFRDCYLDFGTVMKARAEAVKAGKIK